MSRRCRTRNRFVVCVLGLALSTLLVSPVAGQAATQLHLAGQTSYVNADGTLVLALEWNGSNDPELVLSVTVHGRIFAEDELDSAPGQVINRTNPVPVNELPRDEDGHLVAEVPIRSFSPGDASRLLIRDPGVYPITVEIRGPDGLVSSIRTNLIRLPTETAELQFLPVATLLTVSSADGLTLPEATALLADHPSIPITVLLGGGVVSQLIDDPGQAASFRAALGERPVLAIPELDLDPSALAAIDQGDLYAEALDRSRRDLLALGFTLSDGVLPIDVPLTRKGAGLLLDLGYELIVDVGDVPKPGGYIATDDQQLRVLQVDDELTAELAGPQRAVERAHRLLARLALRFETDRTPVVLGGANVANASVASLDIVMSAVDELGLLEAASLESTESAGGPIRPSESPAQDLEPLAGELAQALASIETYESFRVAGGTAPATLRAELIAAVSRELNPDTRASAVEAVIASVESALDVVSLPETQSVTIAARSSEIPLTIDNGASGARSVLLRFQTDKINVLQDNEIVEIPAGTSSLNIEVETRSVGLSPLEILVLTPDGQQELARTKFQVRSTAVPGLGMLLSGAALVFLLIWWGRSILRTRREREGPSKDELDVDLAEPERTVVEVGP